MKQISCARRLQPAEREKQLLDVAVKLAQTVGYKNITCTSVAEAAGLRSHGLITHYFGDMHLLRRQVIARAIQTENLEILIQGLVVRDLQALAAPTELKKRALTSFNYE